MPAKPWPAAIQFDKRGDVGDAEVPGGVREHHRIDPASAEGVSIARTSSAVRPNCTVNAPELRASASRVCSATGIDPCRKPAV